MLPIIFSTYAGWADKLDMHFLNRTTEPFGVAGQIIPLELSLC
jgi:hypothetical protein